MVSEANPRYFTVASGDAADPKAVYLTGSHIWNNFHDGLGPGASCAEEPERNDYRAYLDFLTDHGHNFIRLWRWEHVKSQAAGGAFHLCMTPQPWSRTGPGAGTDGKPKFDLSSFDQAYFDRLRDRVIAAGDQGIYVVDYQVLPLDARVQALQEAYIRKVVDTVQDLPGVLYEVANEAVRAAAEPEEDD